MGAVPNHSILGQLLSYDYCLFRDSKEQPSEVPLPVFDHPPIEVYDGVFASDIKLSTCHIYFATYLS